MLVMCALGVSAVLGVDAIIIPFKPESRSTSSFGGPGEPLTILRQEACQSSTCRPSSDNQEICFNSNRPILQHSWRLAIVLNLRIGISRLEFRHGNAIGISRRTAREAGNLQVVADYFEHIEDRQVTGLRDAFQWCVMVE
jgi:hypothetical protein